MEANKLSNVYMQRTAECEAWKYMSRVYPFNAQDLEKYADKLDWNAVSKNHEIHWTISLLEKFKKKINWKNFSRCNHDDLF